MFIQTEITPNPNSLKFLPGKTVSNNGSFEITKKEETDNDLVRNILSINGVTGVFLGKDFMSINKKRNAFMDVLQNDGVSTRPATHAVHMLQYYREKYEVIPEDFPNAYIANECSISFPLFNGLTDEEQKFVIKTIENKL